jgi:hypothetical protein
MRKLPFMMVRVLLAGTMLTLVACASPVLLTPPAEAPAVSTAPAVAPASGYVIELTDETQAAPPTMPAGIRNITAANKGQNLHAVVFRRLNEGVTLEQFTAAFAENPFASMRLTAQLGGPDVAPGASIAGYFDFRPGVHVLVDNAVEPRRFAAFTVEESAEVSPALPAAAVSVEMKDGELALPAAIKSGAQWWQFTNGGQQTHMMAIVKLAADKTVDDIVAWDETGEGPEPFEWVAFWNVMSPGVTSWGQLELPAGAYWVLDFATAQTEEGMSPPALGAMKEFTVTE